MTRQDFIMIADTIKTLPRNVRIPVTLIFTERLKERYLNFDPEKFREYIEKE